MRIHHLKLFYDNSKLKAGGGKREQLLGAATAQIPPPALPCTPLKLAALAHVAVASQLCLTPAPRRQHLSQDGTGLKIDLELLETRRQNVDAQPLAPAPSSLCYPGGPPRPGHTQHKSQAGALGRCQTR